MPEPPVARASLKTPKRPPVDDYSKEFDKVFEKKDENKIKKQTKKVKVFEEEKDETFTPGEIKKYIPVKAKSDAFDFESNTG